MDYSKDKQKGKVVELKSRWKDENDFTIKKLKKKRREKYLSKNQKIHVISKYYDDFNGDFRSPA